CATAGLAANPIAPWGAWQSQVFAQCLTGILPVEQAAPLQLGHYEAHEVLIGAGDVGGSEHKAIAGLGCEPLLQPFRDLVWRAGEDRQFLQCATRAVLDKIARGRMALTTEADDAVQDGSRPTDRRQGRIRERLVQTVRREVEVEHLRE